ncbi:hypothetical protein HanXRQr2_Chr15g0682541 [Helianthus annuus]|uniref:Uncharacterized protein n=1 Tax=Helianthus annuus TaxID=4232 RepID=A0A9K3DZS7_HELAN|nr:hypothetical protein HanXRQr2_Chr15g0682541 [Helianthus annuus]
MASVQGGLKSSKKVTIHIGVAMLINAGENWQGRGSVDNTMSLLQDM